MFMNKRASSEPQKIKKSQKKVKKPLSLKQLKYVKAKAQGKSNTRAAMEATGASFGVAAVQAHRFEKNQTIQEMVLAEMQRQGLDLGTVIRPIADGIKADKDFFDKDGDLLKTVPDHTIRLRAAGMAHSLMGLTNMGDSGGGDIHFHLHSQGQKGQYGL
jgi:hypothetical protein